MPNQPIPVVINPAARRGHAGKVAAEIAGSLRDQGLSVEMLYSNGVGDVEDKVFAAATAGATKIIVAGGDGTIHEAVNGIIRAGSATALGVIPLGTGNDFAKACSIPLRWEVATRELASRLCSDNTSNGKGVRRVDIGRMNQRYFANSAGIGFDAKINAIALGNRLPIGALNYLRAVFQGVWDGVISPQVRLRYGSNHYVGPVTLVEVCNGAYVGGMFHIAPMAKNNDGKLDLIFVQPVSRLRIFALLPRLMKGTHVSAPEVTCAEVTSVSLLAEADVPAQLDGEIQPPSREFEIELLPGALEIL
jgi:diacylglycerol kinase (ATP)